MRHGVRLRSRTRCLAPSAPSVWVNPGLRPLVPDGSGDVYVSSQVPAKSRTMHHRLMPVRKLLFLLALTSLGTPGACGGSSPGAKSAGGSSDEAGSGERSGRDGNGSGCSGGTCAKCGTAVCLAGYFCLESAAKGPTCSWLPECPSEASCSCVEGVLGDGCSCEERDGGVFVTCE